LASLIFSRRQKKAYRTTQWRFSESVGFQRSR
jgi:hypothetical protein